MIAATATTTHSEELVWTDSEDGIQMHGAVMRPVGRAPRAFGIVYVHGYHSRFYGPPQVVIGRHLAARGYVYVTGNNRGNHLGANLTKSSVASGTQASGPAAVGGALWERFEECPYDIGGWIDFTLGLGVTGVVLVGHSYGGAKVLYYQAQRQDPRVAGLVLASAGPVRFDDYREPEVMELARRMVTEGRGHELMPWPGGVRRAWSGGSARTYLDHESPAHDVFGIEVDDPAIARIPQPILAFYGTEQDVGGPSELEAIRRRAKCTRVDTATVAGAIHSYAGSERDVVALIGDWVDGLPGPAGPTKAPT